MNYKKIHDNIINKAKSENRNKSSGIFELHHIKMKSIYPKLKYDPNNLVLLTPKEHFLIHYLLWKMNPNDRRYRDPIFMFKHKGAKNSRLYEAARIDHIKEMKYNNPSTNLSEKAKESKSNKLKKYVKTEQHRKNISKANKGKTPRKGAVLTEDTKTKISNSVKQWYKNIGVSEETRQKIREASTGRKHTKETINLMAIKASNRKKWKCPHCDKQYDGGNLKQHMIRNGFSLKEIDEWKQQQRPEHTDNYGLLTRLVD